jgi:cellobiose-specific phosphotransferase system component IIB
MYNCEICNYETTARTALYNHRKSKKHLTKIQNNMIPGENKIIEKQLKEIDELREKLIKIEKEKELLIKDNIIEKSEMKAMIYKEMAEKPKSINQGIIINNNTNNMNYVNKHFKNAPPLKKISNYKINGIDIENNIMIDNLIENIILSCKNKSLHKLIGDHIIENYKKDDLQLQSFHATDVARRKYLVKLEDNMEYLYDSEENIIDSDSDEYITIKKEFDKQNKKITIKNKSKWTNDNEGVKISYLLYDPLIKCILGQLKKKCNDYNKEIKKNTNKIPTYEEMEQFVTLANILNEIDKDKLKKNINNYIAPYFELIRK